MRIRTYAFCHGDNFLLIRSTFILTFQPQHNYDATILRTSTQKTWPCNRPPTRTTTPRPALERPATPERPASPKSRLLSPEWHENSVIKVNTYREQMDAMAHRNQWRNWSKVCDMLNAERNIQESLKMELSHLRHGIFGNDWNIVLSVVVLILLRKLTFLYEGEYSMRGGHGEGGGGGDRH